MKNIDIVYFYRIKDTKKVPGTEKSWDNENLDGRINEMKFKHKNKLEDIFT